MEATVPVGLFAVAAAMAVAGTLLARRSGSHLSLGRRLAGAAQLRVGELLDMDPLPKRPVRVAGRIRCPDPIVTADDDRLVAFHRDVEVLLPDGRWRTIERLRETRGFELWDHDGSVTVDPSHAAEPLVAIPHVWRGSPDELVEGTYQAAVARLVEQGLPPRSGRSVTRSISVVDRLLVLAVARRAGDGGLTLVPPPGGFIVSALELADAMRLLGGPRRSWLLAGVALIAAAAVLGMVALAVLVIG